jgi:pimeloyl-ACP methyl ester carboxylesterase
MSKPFRIFTAAALLLASSMISTGSAEAAAPLKSIVLVHGAFADGSSWDRVVTILQAKGYNVVAVHESLSSLANDVATTKRAIDAQPGEVILVGHSYGGAVITEAGNDPKVTGLVYIAAFAPDAGESINDLGKGKPAPSWAASMKVDSAGFASLPEPTILSDFAPDLPSTEARVLASKQGPIFMGSFDEKIKKAAWHSKPVWYIQTALDHMIDPLAQAAMAKRMNAVFTSVPSSHVAMIAKPNEVAAVVMAAASSTRTLK